MLVAASTLIAALASSPRIGLPDWRRPGVFEILLFKSSPSRPGTAEGVAFERENDI